MTTVDAVRLRPAVAADAESCGRICFDAFHAASTRHGLPPDFSDTASATATLASMISRPGCHAVVAERDGVVVGSNFVDERSSVAGVGPVTVDPAHQDKGVGRALMEAVLDRERKRGAASVRLVQSAFHGRSLGLYATLGFDVREPLAVFVGTPTVAAPEGCAVRPGGIADVPACNRLCARVHGHDRAGELADAVRAGSLRIVRRNAAITGYATSVGYFGHAAGETWRDVAALIAAAGPFDGPGVIVPIRDGGLFRWCLAAGLRVTQPMTLMTIGPYIEPRGAWLPSILF